MIKGIIENVHIISSKVTKFIWLLGYNNFSKMDMYFETEGVKVEEKVTNHITYEKNKMDGAYNRRQLRFSTCSFVCLHPQNMIMTYITVNEVLLCCNCFTSPANLFRSSCKFLTTFFYIYLD